MAVAKYNRIAEPTTHPTLNAIVLDNKMLQANNLG